MTDGHEKVRTGILKQAIYDYQNALVKNDDGQIQTLENWFLSEWGEALSGNNGAYIIENARKEMGK